MLVQKIEVDTCHFKGNFPDQCSLQASLVTPGTDQSAITESMFWPTLVPLQKLQMDQQHFYAAEITSIGAISHVRFNIYPDGGVSRLRIWGTKA